jgi:hypothetical protein
MQAHYLQVESGLWKTKKPFGLHPGGSPLGVVKGRAHTKQLYPLPHRQPDLNSKHIFMQAAKTRQKSGKSGKPFAIRRTVDY